MQFIYSAVLFAASAIAVPFYPQGKAATTSVYPTYSSKYTFQNATATATATSVTSPLSKATSATFNYNATSPMVHPAASCTKKIPVKATPSEPASKYATVLPPTANIPESEPYKTFAHSGPVDVLLPSRHWTVDGLDLGHLVPCHPDDGHKLYYSSGGTSDWTKPHSMALIEMFFNDHSVVLDHSDYITQVVYMQELKELIISFDDKDAFQVAMKAWSSDDALIFITHMATCGDFDDSQSCYFVVTKLVFIEKDMMIEAFGYPAAVTEVLKRGEAEWGRHVPTGYQASPGGYFEAGPGTNDGDRYTSGDGNQGGDKNSTLPADRTADSTTRAWNDTCKAPVDKKYGLPTACLGPVFDQILDDRQDYEPLSKTNFNKFIAEMAPGVDDESSFGKDVSLENLSLTEEEIYGNDGNGSIKMKRFFGRIIRFVARVLPPIEGVTRPKYVDLFQRTVPVLIPRELKQPACPKNNPPANCPGLGESPWPKSIFLKSLSGSKEKAGSTNVGKTTGKGSISITGTLDIFCVDCGVKGNLFVSGRVGFMLAGGLTSGQVIFGGDLTATMQVGLNAQIVITGVVRQQLVSIGIPGLSVPGLLDIGPTLSLDAEIDLEIAAEGQLLAGASVSLQNARATVDFVDWGKSGGSGWTPQFKPIFEASGSIKASAELGLPIAVNCGISILSGLIRAQISLIEKPSLKATAEVAASIGLVDGAWKKGFTSANGCTGISTQLFFRNVVSIDILRLKRFTLHDTNDIRLAQACIRLPGGNLRRTIDAPERRLTIDSRQASSNNFSNSSMPVLEQSITYVPANISSHAYNRTDGYEYTTLVDTDNKYLIASCFDGNIYLQPVNGDTMIDSYCSEMWAERNHTAVTDGESRVIHIYNQTMAATGVSRLRVSDHNELPTDSIGVVLQPVDHDEDPTTPNIYVAGTMDDYYVLAVCEYKDPALVAKVFAMKDPVKGIAMLESADVMYSITGGDVKHCYVLPLKENGGETHRYPVDYDFIDSDI